MRLNPFARRAPAPPPSPAAIGVQRYWLLTVLGMLVPILVGIPYLMDAVPRAVLLCVAFAAWQTAKVMKPNDTGSAWIFKLGLLVMLGAVGIMFLVSIAYVVRHGVAVPDQYDLGMLIVGNTYCVLLHFVITRFIQPRWRIRRPKETGLKA